MGERQAIFDMFKFAEIALIVGVAAVIGFMSGFSVAAPILVWRGKAHRIPALGIGLSALAAVNAVFSALMLIVMQMIGWIQVKDEGLLITAASLAVGILTVLAAMVAHKFSKIRLKRIKVGSSEIELYDERRKLNVEFSGDDRRIG